MTNQPPVNLKRVLEARKLTVWFDEDQLRPGVNWQPLLEQGLERAGSVIVALGGSGMARWQSQETQVALNRADATGNPRPFTVAGTIQP